MSASMLENPSRTPQWTIANMTLHQPAPIGNISMSLPHENSIATVCLSGQLPDKLQAIAEAGFKAVDIFEDDLLYYSGSVAEVGALCQRLGLKVLMYQAFRDFEGALTAETFNKNIERYGHIL